MKVKSTDKTRNLEVDVGCAVPLDEMEAVLDEVAAERGLYLSHVTKLGEKRYPGNRHWHLKQDAGTIGCLDVTYWPAGPLMWVSMRHSEPAWVHEVGQELPAALAARLERLT